MNAHSTSSLTDIQLVIRTAATSLSYLSLTVCRCTAHDGVLLFCSGLYVVVDDGNVSCERVRSMVTAIIDNQRLPPPEILFFFLNDPAPPEISPLPHPAPLPI